MIINYLNPIYILIKDNLYYFFLRIVLYFSWFYITLPQFIILETAEAFALLGFSVYLEIIQLYCFKLDVNLSKNIIKRANNESIDLKHNIEEEEEVEERDVDESFEDDNL